MSTAINTVSNVFPQSLSENVLYTGKQATTTSFVVLLISLFIFTLNTGCCITSAIAKHLLVKQEMNSKPEALSAYCHREAGVRLVVEGEYIRRWPTRKTSVWLSLVAKRSECKQRCV